MRIIAWVGTEPCSKEIIIDIPDAALDALPGEVERNYWINETVREELMDNHVAWGWS